MEPKIGASRPGLWLIKHVVAPLQRRIYRATGGRAFRWGRRNRNILLLTTTGRKTGRSYTTPVFFLRADSGFVICNVTPANRPRNPWVLNALANPGVSIQIGTEVMACRARVAGDDEVRRYWPELVALWPSYDDLFRRGGKRQLLILEPARQS